MWPVPCTAIANALLNALDMEWGDKEKPFGTSPVFKGFDILLGTCDKHPHDRCSIHIKISTEMAVSAFRHRLPPSLNTSGSVKGAVPLPDTLTRATALDHRAH